MKFITIISIIGVIPFYMPELNLFNKVLFNSQHIQIYGLMIISFLSGMQWQRLIFEDSSHNIVEKILPIITVFTGIILFMLNSNVNLILTFLFFLVLVFDIVFHKQHLSKEYLKLRIIVTLLVIFSFLEKFIN